MMQPSLKDAIRFNTLYPLTYVVDLARLLAAGNQTPCRILIASDNRVYTSEQQFTPLMLYRPHLRDYLGIALNHRLLGDLLSAPSRSLSGYDVIIAKVGFLTPEPIAIDMLTVLRKQSAPAKLIYFDGDDDLCVQWPRVLEIVDLYVKKQVFHNPALYLQRFTGKSNLTDYVARTQGRSFRDNIIPNSGPANPRHLHKITLGYNVASDRTIVDLFNSARLRSDESKDVDVCCRAGFAADDWIKPFRAPVLDVLSSLPNGYTTILSNERVDRKQYYAEMRRSRICVSPFGYGEICWRDFEAIISGCLLVKPDMGHVRTMPNVFIPGETYVPVKWDFSDLAETCRRYLSDTSEMSRITQRAYKVLLDYYDGLEVINRFRELLLVGLGEPTLTAKNASSKSHAI